MYEAALTSRKDPKSPGVPLLVPRMQLGGYAIVCGAGIRGR